MGSEQSERYMPQEVFLNELDSLKQRNRFCFILGSGASRSSGIPTGQDMMEEWRAYLQKLPESVVQFYANQCGMTEARCRSIVFSTDRPKSTDYFDLYDLRYITMQDDGEEYLRETMDKALPSAGYHQLARLMSATKHNVIITTNFDPMAEHAFVLENLNQPQMIGHDSLVRFIQRTTSRRPLIAKVHGDLMLHPLNRTQELQALSPAWQEKLKRLLTDYIPIVIGYAGGDHTLMEFLEGLEDLPRVYWCSMWEREDERIERFLLGGVNRYHVQIEGFDQIMEVIYRALMPASVQQKSAAQPKPKAGSETIKPWGILSKEKLHTFVGDNIIEQVIFLDTRVERPPADAVDLCENIPRGVVGWKNHRVLCLAGEGGVAAPADCRDLFAKWDKLHTISGAELFDTSGVKIMGRMFSECSSLRSVSLEHWDTSKVIMMSGMFFSCAALPALDLSHWNTSKVRNMVAMFSYCYGLQTLNLNGWDTSQVEDKRYMFYGTRWQNTPLL